jgi:hypothetical protein
VREVRKGNLRIDTNFASGVWPEFDDFFPEGNAGKKKRPKKEKGSEITRDLGNFCKNSIVPVDWLCSFCYRKVNFEETYSNLFCMVALKSSFSISLLLLGIVTVCAIWVEVHEQNRTSRSQSINQSSGTFV